MRGRGSAEERDRNTKLTNHSNNLLGKMVDNETHTGKGVYDFHFYRNHVPPSCTSMPPDVAKKRKLIRCR